jgi:ABC-2 type transport system permease protein
MRINKEFVKALVLRDLRRYFSNPTGYVFITLFIFLSAAAAFWQDRFFLNNLANLDELNQLFPFLLLFFIPALTMSVWSEEKRQSTDELLLTMPARSFEVVLGKYLSTLGIYTAALLLSLSHVIVLYWLGRPDPGVMFSNYLGYWLLGAALISLGLVASQLTANTAIAFILGAAFCALAMFIGSLVGILSPVFGHTLDANGLVAHFQDFASGVVSLSGIFYFVALAATMLYVNTLIIDCRHWPKQWEGRPTTLHQTVRVVGVVLAVLSINILLGRAGGRLDVTAEHLHSLSSETRTILSELPKGRTVFVQAYVSPEVPQSYVQSRANLLSTLHEIGSIAGSRVQIMLRDTVPFSPEAREAREKFGIVPRQVTDLEGARAGIDQIFMGIAITCGAEEQVIPFLDRGLSPEYELTRSIRVVAGTGRKKVGVLQTAINVFGGLDFQTMHNAPEWPIVEELKKQYEVVRLQPGSEIPSDLDGLLVVLPSSLNQPAMDTLAAAIHRGTPTLLLEDPLPLVSPGLAPSEPPGGNMNPMMRSQAPQEPKGDIGALMAGIGINWNSARVVWDTYNPHPDLASLPPEVIFIGKGNENAEAFNTKAAESAPLQELVLLYPGAFQKAVDTKLNFIPLVETGKVSGAFQYSQLLQRNFFGTQLNRNLRHIPDDAVFTIAAEVRGAAPSAESEAEDPAAKQDSKTDSGDSRQAEKATAKPIHVIAIADVDFISQQFFDLRAQGPKNLNFDNVSFFLNCMDVLTGDDSFIPLRSKRVRHRTLERVEEQTRAFTTQRIQEEKQAESEADAALKEAQAALDRKVADVRQRADLDDRTKQIMARNLQESENRKFEVLKANIESAKEAKIHASRERTEEQTRRIQDGIRTFAVLFPPIPVFVLGVWIFLKRQRREREGAAAARRLRS